MRIHSIKNIDNTPFQAYKMEFTPTVKKRESDKNYKDEFISMVEIDLDNKKDIETLNKISNNWIEAMFIGNIYYIAESISKSKEPNLNYRFYAITSQKDKFEKLDPDKILSICGINTSDNDKEAFIEYIETKPEIIYDINAQYKKAGTALLDGLKHYYEMISLYSVPSRNVLDFYKRNGFSQKSNSKYHLWWNR